MALSEHDLNEAETLAVRLIALGRQGPNGTIEEAGQKVIKTVDELRSLARQGMQS